MPEFNSTTTRQNNIYVWNTDRNRMASDYCTLLVPGRWQTTEIPNRQSQSASLCPIVNKYEAWFLGSDCAFLVPAVEHFSLWRPFVVRICSISMCRSVGKLDLDRKLDDVPRPVKSRPWRQRGSSSSLTRPLGSRRRQECRHGLEETVKAVELPVAHNAPLRLD